MHDDATNIAETQTAEDITFTLSDHDIRDALDALHAQDTDTIHAVINELSPADLAELISKASHDEREKFTDMFA